MKKGLKRRLLKKTLEEVQTDIESHNTDLFDYLGEFLEAFESCIMQAPSKSYEPVRNLQTKIRHILDYLEQSENSRRIAERNLKYFQTTYSQLIQRHNLKTDASGLVISARIREYPAEESPYFMEETRDPFRSHRR